MMDAWVKPAHDTEYVARTYAPDSIFKQPA
jgi:hypothetical protein